MKIFQPFCNSELIHEYAAALKGKTVNSHYSLVFGMVAQHLGISKKDALSGFYYNSAVGFVTNCVKLIPLSQQSGQEILFSLHTLIGELAEKSILPEQDLTGLCCPGFDIRSMQPERLYSRLYMS